MDNRINRIKQHFVEHEEKYVFGVSCFFVGFTVAIMRGRYASFHRKLDGPIVTVRPLNFLGKQVNNILTVIQREGRGHPGYLVRCLETNDYYFSQNEVANAMSVWPSLISDHLNGKVESIHGFHFERIGALN